MFTYCVSIIVEVVLETLISNLLTQLWQWLREDERVQKLQSRLKLQILAWYLKVLLTTTKYPKNYERNRDLLL